MPDAQYRVKVGDAEYLVTAPDANAAWQWANMAHAQAAGPKPEQPKQPAPKAEPTENAGFWNSLFEGAQTLGLADEVAAYKANPNDKTRRALVEAAQSKYKHHEFGEGENWEALKEVAGGSIGQMLAPIGAGLAGAFTTTPVGGLVAAGSAGFSQYTINNMVRQAQEQEAAAARGETPQDPSLTRAAAAAIPQTALDLAAGPVFGKVAKLFPFMRPLLGKAGAAATAEAGEVMADAFANGTIKFAKGVATGVGKGIRFEVPQEIAQQGLERWQAGLSLTDDDALHEYGQAAIGAAVLGGAFGAVEGSVDTVKGKRAEALEKREAEERRAADAVDLEGQIGDEYNKAYAGFRRQGMSEQEALVAASQAIQPIAERLRAQSSAAREEALNTAQAGAEPAPDASTTTPPTDTEAEATEATTQDETPIGAEPVAEAEEEPAPAPLREPTKKEVKRAAMQVDADLDLFGDDIEAEYGTRTLTPEQRVQAATMVAADPNIAPFDAIGSVLRTAERTTTEATTPTPDAGVKTVQEAAGEPTTPNPTDLLYLGKGADGLHIYEGPDSKLYRFEQKLEGTNTLERNTEIKSAEPAPAPKPTPAPEPAPAVVGKTLKERKAAAKQVVTALATQPDYAGITVPSKVLSMAADRLARTPDADPKQVFDTVLTELKIEPAPTSTENASVMEAMESQDTSNTAQMEEYIAKRRAELAAQEAADAEAEAKLRAEMEARQAQAEPEPAAEEQPETVAETATVEQVMQNPVYFAKQEADKQGLDAPMFAEGARDAMQGREPLTPEEITEKQGPEYANAYAAGMQWAQALQPQEQTQEQEQEQAEPEAAQEEPAPQVNDAHDDLLNEIEDLMYDEEGNPAPQISEQAYNLLTKAAELKKVPVEKIREQMEKAKDTFASEQYDGMYRRAGTGAGLSAAEVEDHVADLTSKWKTKVPVRVVESLDELPPTLQEAVKADKAEGAQGFVSPDGTVYVMAHNLDALDDATATLYHEVLGHKGLRALFGKRLDQVLQSIYDSNESLREQADQWLLDNPKAYPKAAHPKLRALEEVLAEQSEAGRVNASIWAKLVAVVKDFGRRIGIGSNFSDAEVRAILAMAHDQIVNGNRESAVVKGLRYVNKTFGNLDTMLNVERMRGDSIANKPPSEQANKEDRADTGNRYARKPKVRANVRKLTETLAISQNAAEMDKTASELYLETRNARDAIDRLSASWNSLNAKRRRLTLKFLAYDRDLLRWVDKYSPPLSRKLRLASDTMRRMNGTRNRMMRNLTYNTNRWAKFNLKFKEGGELLANLLNGSTLVQVDPRFPTLADAIANDPTFQELVRQGAAKRTLNDREALIKYIYDLHQQLALRKNGQGQGQRLYDMAIKAYERAHDREFQLSLQDIRDSGTSAANQAAAIKQITDIYNSAKKISPYAPLSRNGDYWVRVGKGVNRITQSVSGETAWYVLQTKMIRDLQQAGDTRTADEIKADPSTFSAGRDFAGLQSDYFANEPAGVLKRAFDAIDTANSSNASAIKDLVFQMYVSSLPVNASSKRLMHREGVRGFSADVLRGFADSQSRAINRYARLSHGRDLRNAIGNAYALLEGNPDKAKLSPFVDEMAARAGDMLAPQGGGFWNAFAAFGNKATYFYFLLNVKSMVVQMLHLPTVGLSVLGARYGFGNASAIMARYTATMGNKFGTHKTDENGNIITEWGEPRMGDSKYINDNKDPDLRDALKYAWEEAVDRGILDTTFAGDMMSRRSGPSEQYQSRARRALSATFGFLSGGMHHAERMTREAMYMMAFELDYKKRRAEGIDAPTARAMAAEAAADATLEGMFDYAESAKPRAFKNPLGRLAFQYFTFPIQMVSMLGRSFATMFRLLPTARERVVAAKQFFGVLGTVGMFSGVVGMPFYSLIMGAAEGIRDLLRNMLGDDDDDYLDDEYNPLGERSLDLWFREKFLPEYFGPDSSIAQAMGLTPEQAKTLTRAVKMGPVSALTDMDFGSSMSLDGLFFHDQTTSDTDEDAIESAAFNFALGASGSLAKRLWRGYKYFDEGQGDRAAEMLMPGVIRNILVANRLEKEGNLTTKGDEVKAREWYTTGKLMSQRLGFGSTEVADIQRSNTLARKMIKEIGSKRAEVTDRIKRAMLESQRNPTEANLKAYYATLDKINTFNKQTGYIDPITMDEVIQSFITDAESRAGAVRGLRTSRKYEPYVRGVMDN